MNQRFILTLLLCLGISIMARPVGSEEGRPVQFTLQQAQTSVQSGEWVEVIVSGVVDPDWHVYANPKGPGTGLPFEINLSGFTDVMVEYPVGKRFDIPGLNEWVFAWETNFQIPVRFRLPETTPKGSLKVEIEVNGLTCRESCIPIRETLSGTFDVQGRNVAVNPPQLSENPESSSLWVYLALGFLAGLLLNIMPCVLPVLSLKVLSVITLPRGRALQAALFYSLGVGVVFVALASLMAFANLMWGQQFQTEGFKIAMGMLVVFFTLSLLDCFHWTWLQNRISHLQPGAEGFLGDFFKGILATLLATPCSGPFLGGTLSWASQQTPWVIFSVYSAVGMGMAAPFVLIAAVPRVQQWLPRPGAWMVRFKQGSAFLMLGTLIYLLYLLLPANRMAALSLFLLTAFSGWLFSMSRSFWGQGIAVLCLGSSLFFLWPGTVPDVTQASLNAFSPERVQSALQEGRPVVVDFTADWCPNCKLNEKWVLHTDEILNLFETHKVLFLVADMTHSNSIAEAELDRLGGSSIPFLALYVPDALQEGTFTLRDVYTRKQFEQFFLSALAEAKTPSIRR